MWCNPQNNLKQENKMLKITKSQSARKLTAPNGVVLALDTTLTGSSLIGKLVGVWVEEADFRDESQNVVGYSSYPRSISISDYNRGSHGPDLESLVYNAYEAMLLAAMEEDGVTPQYVDSDIEVVL